MKRLILPTLLLIFLPPYATYANNQEDYLAYHTRVVQAEELIAEKSFKSALEVYEQIFSAYSFVFLRDYKVATQLAWHLGDEAKAIELLKSGIASGWKMKDIKQNKLLKSLRENKTEWKQIKRQYDSLYAIYNHRINSDLRWEVRKMSWKDQSKALLAIFRFSEKAQQKYYEKKFAPKNELRQKRLLEIIESDGYPGEKLIGNEFWIWGIVARRNQISQEFCKKDTMYQHLKPILLSAIGSGELSPFFFALVDDWFISVESNRETGSYGYVADLSEHDLTRSNQLRKEIGLRTVETHNLLIDIQEQTGMWFYFWDKGDSKFEIN